MSGAPYGMETLLEETYDFARWRTDCTDKTDKYFRVIFSLHLCLHYNCSKLLEFKK